MTHGFEKEMRTPPLGTALQDGRSSLTSQNCLGVSESRRSAMAGVMRIVPIALTVCLPWTRAIGATSYDSLLGTFGAIENGELVEFVRIERKQQKYLLFRKHTRQWLAAVEVEPVTRIQLETIIKQPVNVEFEGLGNDTLALLKVPKGWKLGPFVCRTGYWVATVVGPVEVEKL